MRGIRGRATLLVTLLLGASLLVGGIAITSVLRQRLLDNLDATVTAAATDRAALLASGADPLSVTDTQLREAVIWIGDPDGNPIATGGRVVSATAPGGTETGTRTVDLTFEERNGTQIEQETEEIRVHTTTTDTPALGPLVVIVGVELEQVDNPVKEVAGLLLIGAPLLLLLAGGLTWVTADRALRPVESIRRDAERITHHHDEATIAVPTTGDEIERLAATVNDMLDRLASNDIRQRQFIGDASHELKSPLANLRIDIETTAAAEGAPDETAARHLAQIDRLTSIVDDLLALARFDEHQPLHDEPIDLDDVVFDALAAATTGHDRRINIDAISPTRITGEAAQLRRLVRNLIDNATRHAHSAVALSLNTDGDLAVLHVDDDGDGVAPEAREQIFERFARTDSSRDRHAGGTGLGLAIVRRAAQAHGGTVEISTSPLGGARFTVRLPTGDTAEAGAGN